MQQAGSIAYACRTLGIAVITLIPGVLATNVSAQVPTKGLTADEASGMRIIEAAPHFQLWRRWQRCVSTIGHFARGSGTSVEKTISFAFAGCADEEGDLRASLTRDIGPTRAANAVAMTRKVEQRNLTDRHNIITHLKPDEFEKTYGWTIKRRKDGGCFALAENFDPISGASFVAVQQSPNGSFIAFGLRDRLARTHAGPMGGDFAEKLVIVYRRNLSSRSLGLRKFQVVQIKNGFTYAASLSDELAIELQESDYVQFSESSPSKNITFRISGFFHARDSLRRCAQKP